MLKSNFNTSVPGQHLDIIVSNSMKALLFPTNNEEQDGDVKLDVLQILSKLPMDDAPLMHLPSLAKNIIAVALFATIFIGSYFKFVLYKGIFTSSKQNPGMMHRPINILVLISAFIHHATHFIGCIHFILILTIQDPLEFVFGPSYCLSLAAIGEFGIFYLGVGSFGISLYRIMYIRLERIVKYRIGETNLLLFIACFSIGICSLITFLHMIEESSRRVAKNSCNGLSPEQAQIYLDYQLSNGELFTITTVYQKIALFLTMTFQICEFIIYLYFFIWRYRQDNGSIVQLLDPRETRKRNENNVVTFLGQFYGFVVELTFIGVIFLLTHVPSSFSHFVKSIAIISHFLNFGILSAVDVMTSPSLRSYM